jgi:hypothetical protein
MENKNLILQVVFYKKFLTFPKRVFIFIARPRELEQLPPTAHQNGRGAIATQNP